MRAPLQRRAGFSLMEMIGVLAIMAIVASAVTPNLAQRIHRMHATREDEALATLAEAVLRASTLHQAIPGPRDWVAQAGAVAGLGAPEIQYAVPGDPSTARVYLIHPGFAPVTPGSGVFASPLWTQGAAGASSIANARILILGVHKRGLALPYVSGAAPSATAFDAVWNWHPNPSTKEPPSGWPTEWQGNGDYLHVARLNFTPLFHRVTFSNTQYPTKSPYFQVGELPATLLNTAATLDAFFLQNTFLRVYADNDGAARPDTLHLSHTLLSGANFIYASDQWQLH